MKAIEPVDIAALFQAAVLFQGNVHGKMEDSLQNIPDNVPRKVSHHKSHNDLS